ncbi:hypothetical protein KC887_01955 [Candidatus Kaiserbacteria bacterium]|nr:hypothetical protein [Candidatus Kaiserbacteria bacterium]
MSDPKQLLEYVIRPTLELLGLGSPAAEQLLLGTAATESRMGRYLHQINGPALGIYQMEPTTHDDLIVNYLRFHKGLLQGITLLTSTYRGTAAKELIGNLNYATAMARAHYYRVAEALPAFGDIEGQAAYWKKYYNTTKGRGTATHYTENYYRYVGDELWI